jgi:hypothetical protein
VRRPFAEAVSPTDLLLLGLDHERLRFYHNGTEGRLPMPTAASSGKFFVETGLNP